MSAPKRKAALTRKHGEPKRDGEAPPLLAFDRARADPVHGLIGVDEVGRGALAGPVFAGAVRLTPAFFAMSEAMDLARTVDDSKRLSASRRRAVVEAFAPLIACGWLRLGVGEASIAEIERFNILGATMLAMRRAIAGVLESAEQEASPPAPVLVDGRPLRGFAVPHAGIIKGDQQSLAIALAAIHAKVTRDALMEQQGGRFPVYGFEANKGYGTGGHLDAIRLHGACPLHRALFLRKVLNSANSEKTASQSMLFQSCVEE